jgi:hypothetical protein
VINLALIQPHDEVVGADGGHVGTVDHTVKNALKLTRKDSVDDRHHYIDIGLIASIDSGKVWLSADTDVAITFVESEVLARDASARLDEGLEETFPASDAVSVSRAT